ncbi:MAG: hypothetical protein JST00_23495 [Deltaproteobacteria bacterium]|nr:hypothetical protein [Deltaproteobacteria bacterium]
MRSTVVLVLALASLPACQRGEPPAPTTVDAAVAPLPAPQGEAAATADADAGARAATPSSAAPPASAAAAVDAGPDPGTLPQTKDKPEASGAAFDARVAALWDAIVTDDADKGLPAFFPVTAYEQVKAIGNPAGDWRRRLVAAYKRDIHALHKRLGETPSDAKLVRAEVPQDRARWIDPGEESNKLGYYRVYGTRIYYTLDGKERSFDVSSLISWRGEWYVVHLTGFK